MAIEPKDFLDIARKALSIAAIYPTDLQLSSYSKVDGEWWINVTYTYKKPQSLSLTVTAAALAINAETGEIRGFWEGKTWK